MKWAMRTHAALVVAALLSVAGCRKKTPPNITGTFEGSARQLVKYPRLPTPSTYETTMVVTLSDEQETTTAVRFVLDDKVGPANVACEGRAARTDREDGANYLLSTATCRFVTDAGQPNNTWPRCQIQAQTLSLRYHRAENKLTVDGGALDVAFTPTPATDFEACSIWVRAQGEIGAELAARGPATTR